MKYIKTFEGHSIKKSIISKEELSQILPQLNLVTIPYFDNENAILHHIDKNFESNDAAFMLNPPKDVTSIQQNGTTAVLYTKRKTYVIEDISEMEFNEMSSPNN